MKSIYLVLVLSFTLFQTVTASTIQQINTHQLVNDAESVFEGEVVSSRSEMNVNGRIYTYVDLLILDVLVGELDPGSIITLRFTGGTVGELRLDVGSTIPVTGERGIYFVEAKSVGLINPLLGWSQGHFRILADGRIMAGDNRVVVGFEDSSTNGTPANPSELNTPAISKGVARGVITVLPGDTESEISAKSNAKPVLIDEFKASLKALKSK